jgi:hypothetical protein
MAVIVATGRKWIGRETAPKLLQRGLMSLEFRSPWLK